MPPDAREGTLTVGEGPTQDVYQLKFGTLDPIDTEDGVKKRLLDLGFIPVGDTPDEFTTYIKAQIEAFRPLVKDLPSP